LLVAAGQIHDALAKGRGLNSQRVDLLLGSGPFARAIDEESQPREVPAGREVDVLCDGPNRNNSLFFPILGAEDDPLADRCGRTRDALPMFNVPALRIVPPV
jgi:hypothetical protein